METNGRLKVADCDVCNGKPITAGDPPKSAVQLRIVGRMTLWGFAMMMVAFFRFFTTWALGVFPEPVNVAIMSVVGVSGVMLLVWGRLIDRVPGRSTENSRHRQRYGIQPESRFVKAHRDGLRWWNPPS